VAVTGMLLEHAVATQNAVRPPRRAKSSRTMGGSLALKPS
jgi:hypothetical protein